MASKQGFDPAVLFLEGLSREITDDELKCLKRQCQSTGLVPPGGEIEKGSAGDLFMELYRKGLTSPGSHDIFISLLRAIPREDLITKYCSFFEGQSSGQTKYSSFFVGKVADFLRTFYRSRLSEIQPLPWCHDFFLPLNDVYTNLQFSEKDRRGRSSDSFRLQVSQLFETIMGSARLPRRVRVEGSPGIGKSTFCHKVLYEWACGKLPQFSAAFLIEMRDYSGDIAGAIIEQLPEEYQIMFSKDELWDQLLRDSSDLLFVLDGLDEIDRDAFENSDLDNLIQGKTMYGSTVIVTSRPHEFDAILKFCQPNLTITGYTSNDRDNFIVNYFEDRVDMGNKLIKEIQSKHILSEICQTPLNTILLCVLLEENAEKLPDTITELYASLVLAITKNYCTTRKGVEIDGDELPDDISSKLCKLGEYAWQGLRENRLIFRQSEISPEELLLTGFLAKNVGVSRIKRSKTCNFLHKTFQEYFAGLYISSKLNDTDTAGSDFHDIVEKDLYTVGLFVCGLLGKEAKLLVKEFSKKLENKSDKEKFELLLQRCLLYVHESGGHEAVASIVASELPTDLSLKSIGRGYTLTNPALNNQNQPFSVYLDHQSVSGLCSVLKNSHYNSKNPTGIQHLILSRELQKSHIRDVLANLSENTSVELLDVDIYSDGPQTTDLSTAIERCTNIKDVSLSVGKQNSETDDQLSDLLCSTVAKLFAGLKSNQRREKFRIIINDSSLIWPFPNLPLAPLKDSKLTELEMQIMSMCVFVEQGLIDSIGELLRNNTNLTTFTFLTNSVAPKRNIDFTTVREALEQNTTLRCFKFWFCSVDGPPVLKACCPDVTPLFRALDSNTTIQELSFTISEPGYGICDILRRNSTLTDLTFFFSNDVGDLAVNVLWALIGHKTLHKLCIRYGGSMSSEVLNCLSCAVGFNFDGSLQIVRWDTLYPRSVHVNASSLETLRDSLKVNETLRELLIPPMACTETEYPELSNLVLQIKESKNQQLSDLKLSLNPPEKGAQSFPSNEKHTIKVFGSDKSKGPAFIVEDGNVRANEDVLDSMSERERNSVLHAIKGLHDQKLVEIPQKILKKYF